MSTSRSVPVTPEFVREFAAVLGIALSEDRLEAVASRFSELMALAAPLDDIDLGVRPPDATFDPSWPETDGGRA